MLNLTINQENDSSGREEMNMFDYIQCHQHREMDILVHCCFEVGI